MEFPFKAQLSTISFHIVLMSGGITQLRETDSLTLQAWEKSKVVIHSAALHDIMSVTENRKWAELH